MNLINRQDAKNANKAYIAAVLADGHHYRQCLGRGGTRPYLGITPRGRPPRTPQSSGPCGRPPVFTIMKRHSQQGVALIITLILLAVVTVMAVAFLASSRRERGAVTTTTDTASARLAADAALAQAEAQIMAKVFVTTNTYNFGLVVSTNYINGGFDTTVTGYDPTNVNYNYNSANGGGPVAGNDALQNSANLLYSPRAPVFIQTNSANTAAPLDFRFYLDLNRNGMFDTNGYVVEVDNNNNIVRTNFNEIGDPEWIGVLNHPDQPHGPNNRFIARYAFIAVPIGNGLDLNAIHNQARSGLASGVVNSPTANDTFMRNQGVGSWEINLAAFLADLNTNQWNPPTIENPANDPYDYLEPNNFNTGVAFDDARALLAYRYDNNFAYLPAAYLVNFSLFANGSGFLNNIDGYSQGPLMTTTTNINASGQNVGFPWAGADNTNQFFDMQELYNTNETAIGVTGTNFTQRLQMAGSSTNTYDRYTFYRMMSQLGVDSAPEQNQLNLNYRNVTNGVIVPGMETNFYPWSAVEFFTNAADRMLRAYSQDWLASDPADYMTTYDMTTNIGTPFFPTNIPVSFGITNIPVWIGASNQFVYSSAIQRVLQLAANIYDATTNNTAAMLNNFPSVFRPTFNVVLDQNGFTNVYINGYQQVVSVSGINDVQLSTPTNVTSLRLGPSVLNYANGVNVYGVPWIIGAKKGFPNFNQFSMQEIVGVERRLQVTRPGINAASSVSYAGFQTNQMYTMVITNWLGVDCWNSYSSNYVPVVPPGNLNIVAQDSLSMTLTNDDGMTPITQPASFANAVNITTFWPGSAPWYGGKPNANSFDIPLVTNFAMPLNPSYPTSTNWWQYRFDSSTFYPIPNSLLFEANVNNNFLFPHFVLLTTNYLQVFMLDGTHVIDYVQFAGPNSSLDLKTNIFTDSSIGGGTIGGTINGIGNGTLGVWNTNLSTSVGAPDGILNQIQVSRGGPPPTFDGLWNSDNNTATPPEQQAFFAAFFMPNNVANVVGWNGNPRATAQNLELSVEAPYSPIRYVVQYTTWQANDPLVHYVAGDLNYTVATAGTPYPGINVFNYGQIITNLPDLGALNDHYSPWGGNPLYPPNANTPDDPNVVDAINLAVKDPLIYLSDNWDFPTNKLPTVGWLGRVHRGTPWQTVDLKSVLPNTTTWANWTGDFLGNGLDAYNSSPAQDRQLFDLFSTAFNDNATRGQLSVNVGANDTNNPQAGLAAWSALFSGVVVPTNTIGGYTIIQPAGAAGSSSLLGQLVTNINATRATFINDDGLVGSFEHVGDILAAPFLTISNQWLFANNANTNVINDEMYEWLPQQTLSLLRVGGSPQSPMRYVVYCYGQTLKPAPNGIVVTGGPFFGMCTNYQIVSEIATRAVVRFNSVVTNVPAMITNSLNQLVWTNAPTPSFVTNNNAVIESFNVLPPE
jgi:hypothetical protein